LSAYRESAAMANAAIASDFRETLDIQGDFATKIAFYLLRLVDRFANAAEFVFRQIAHARIRINAGRLQQLLGSRLADPEDVRQGDYHALVARNVNTSNTSHRQWAPPLTLFLFVFRIFANDHDIAFAANDFAFFADRLDRRSHLHDCILLT